MPVLDLKVSDRFYNFPRNEKSRLIMVEEFVRFKCIKRG